MLSLIQLATTAFVAAGVAVRPLVIAGLMGVAARRLMVAGVIWSALIGTKHESVGS